MPPNKSFWSGKKVLITGNTGFKGAWLSLWLHGMGSKVFGISLNQEHPRAIFNVTKLDSIISTCYLDINDFNNLFNEIKNINPDIIFHLAAQPLVIESINDPLYTFNTNIIICTFRQGGTMNGHAFEREVIIALKNLGLNVRQSSDYEDRCQLFDFLVISNESPDKNITVQITLFPNNYVKMAEFAETYEKRGRRRSLYVQVRHVSTNNRYLVQESASVIAEVLCGHLQEEDVLIGLDIFLQGQLKSESNIFDLYDEIAELKQREAALVEDTRKSCTEVDGSVIEWQKGSQS